MAHFPAGVDPNEVRDATPVTVTVTAEDWAAHNPGGVMLGPLVEQLTKGKVPAGTRTQLEPELTTRPDHDPTVGSPCSDKAVQLRGT